MKIIMYKLISLFLLGLTWNNVWAQTIDGPTEICPSSLLVTTYELIDYPCDAIANLNWQLDYPVSAAYGGSNPVVITWSTTGADDEAILSVTYDCINYSSDGTPVVTKDTVELEIAILNINEPIITSSSLVELTCSETEFTVNIASQPGSATYSVTHPDCFGYSYSSSSSQFNFTTDNSASGEICITIYQPSCGTSRTECITVTRECEDNLTFSSASPISNSYNPVNNYITASDVSTASFSNLEFKAGKAILLQPGFSGDKVFLAHIGPCSCVPDGQTGCFYQRSAQSTSTGTSSTRRNPQSSVNPDYIAKQQTRLVSTEDAVSNAFSIYPNPSSGAFTIHFEKQPLNATIQIFDIMGRLQKSIPANNPIQVIDASELESGVYLVVVSGQEHLFKEKIIISK
ncbi:T9SS type A sorting domain-containing protein [Aureispira anguillae]|uniref:T9SS type A sorting domain-containing protein n=1 Tax=Aureispira anguillae TaxID=2864201 RepID=A0A915YLV6_9BACT|nr:T9SS type A sorting domain-containing protein [Aureispira anguillae]BDS15617.1 T9SS type A sorting domain-containing protein [Aureispira anguillae]